jgi:hypothetical protein
MRTADKSPDLGPLAIQLADFSDFFAFALAFVFAFHSFDISTFAFLVRFDANWQHFSGISVIQLSKA